jgi:hypothetical protein
MSRTIKAIERHMILPVRSGCQDDTDSSHGERRLVAEWQRGAEILGHTQGKLRLAFASSQSTNLARVNC